MNSLNTERAIVDENLFPEQQYEINILNNGMPTNTPMMITTK